MQAYGRVFARLYNQRWGFFARQVGPKLIEYCESLPVMAANRRVLDLCCGAGHLAAQFLARGYSVVGLDLSWDMLAYAREAVLPYLDTGRVLLVQGDASRFALLGGFGLAVSTFDALNHLPSLAALEGCFAATWRSLAPGGCFVFDLNTRRGFRRWNGISVDDSAEAMIVNRGIYGEQSDRALEMLSGFVRLPNGLYERFEEAVYESVFDLAQVQEALLRCGFPHVRLARWQDLHSPLAEPEEEDRVFFIATK